MNYSVVIPSLANEATLPYLKLCVESLRASGFGGSIIVVTNGTKHKPALDIEGITIHTHVRTPGQCGAVNIGAQLVPPYDKFMMVSNDDMYYAPGWDEKLPKDMPLVWSPNLVEPENNAGSAQPFLKCDGGYTLDEFNKDRVDHFVSKNKENTMEAGFNLPFFINMDVWRSIGGYDTTYDPWGSNSDTDLQTLINIAGITPVRLRDVLVYHFSNKSGTFDGTHQEEWQRNFDYYRTKFGYTRDDEPQADVWYNTNMVLEDKLTFEPEWKGKYLET